MNNEEEVYSKEKDTSSTNKIKGKKSKKKKAKNESKSEAKDKDGFNENNNDKEKVISNDIKIDINKEIHNDVNNEKKGAKNNTISIAIDSNKDIKNEFDTKYFPLVDNKSNISNISSDPSVYIYKVNNINDLYIVNCDLVFNNKCEEMHENGISDVLNTIDYFNQEDDKSSNKYEDSNTLNNTSIPPKLDNNEANIEKLKFELNTNNKEEFKVKDNGDELHCNYKNVNINSKYIEEPKSVLLSPKLKSNNFKFPFLQLISKNKSILDLNYNNSLLFSISKLNSIIKNNPLSSKKIKKALIKTIKSFSGNSDIILEEVVDFENNDIEIGNKKSIDDGYENNYSKLHSGDLKGVDKGKESKDFVTIKKYQSELNSSNNIFNLNTNIQENREKFISSKLVSNSNLNTDDKSNNEHILINNEFNYYNNNFFKYSTTNSTNNLTNQTESKIKPFNTQTPFGINNSINQLSPMNQNTMTQLNQINQLNSITNLKYNFLNTMYTNPYNTNNNYINTNNTGNMTNNLKNWNYITQTNQFSQYQKLHKNILEYSKHVDLITTNLKDIKNEAIKFISDVIRDCARASNKNGINSYTISSIDVYGSFANDLAIESSDIDISIIYEQTNNFKYISNDIINKLKLLNVFENIEPILTASVPVIKIVNYIFIIYIDTRSFITTIRLWHIKQI